ncbi:MAG: metal-dependent hydrolase [Sphingomonadaceae bacterium]|nr:metal-dependent hydrolase [Sphingomonadaceae bacterium]
MASNAKKVPETASQTDFDIPIRRHLRWDFSEVGPDFIERSKLENYFWLSASLAAPYLEKFFIRVLQPTIPDIDDQKLAEDTKNMLAQEAMHSMVHNKFNKHIANQGVKLDASHALLEESVDWLSGYSTIDLIGVVAAGEHIIYSLSIVFLNCEETRMSMTPQARQLFDFHCLEETEHGAVSHDLYRYFVGESYWTRIRTALVATRLIWTILVRTMRRLINENGDKITWREKLSFFKYAIVKPGTVRKLIGHLFQYLHPRYKMTFDHGDKKQMKRVEERVNLFSEQAFPGT